MKPIIEIVEQMHHDMMVQKENAVLKAVNEIDVVVDKERLLQALSDAKAFYGEGYRDAMRKRIVHCRECVHYKANGSCCESDFGICCYWADNDGYVAAVNPDDFCSHGERRVE